VLSDNRRNGIMRVGPGIGKPWLKLRSARRHWDPGIVKPILRQSQAGRGKQRPYGRVVLQSAGIVGALVALCPRRPRDCCASSCRVPLGQPAGEHHAGRYEGQGSQEGQSGLEPVEQACGRVGQHLGQDDGGGRGPQREAPIRFS